MELGHTAGFRPPDQVFVDQFNLVLDATGARLTDVCVLAIKRGLRAAYEELLAERKATEAAAAKARELLNHHLESPESPVPKLKNHRGRERE